MNELKDFKASIGSSFGESSLLLVVEVGGDCENAAVDLLSREIGGGLRKTLELTSGNFGNSNGGWFISLLVLYGKCDCGFVFLGVGGGMAVCWVYRFEAGTVSRILNLLSSTYSCPRKSLKNATVFLLILMSCCLAC